MMARQGPPKWVDLVSADMSREAAALYKGRYTATASMFGLSTTLSSNYSLRTKSQANSVLNRVDCLLSEQWLPRGEKILPLPKFKSDGKVKNIACSLYRESDSFPVYLWMA
ncbi:uncharacterized protein RAG0_01156 [Rhynchosporium agropyri]|uniref:Uncharacterized protein n=1 Tax=Rhynchosporium agropyri TaxID=914238 RepID=A0A1E1JW27_9HELO|nr:uncharacterized protein RAG0_01156 [Rhynchosporium agropyri]